MGIWLGVGVVMASILSDFVLWPPAEAAVQGESSSPVRQSTLDNLAAREHRGATALVLIMLSDPATQGDRLAIHAIKDDAG